MLDNLSLFVESEYVDARVVLVSWALCLFCSSRLSMFDVPAYLIGIIEERPF